MNKTHKCLCGEDIPIGEVMCPECHIDLDKTHDILDEIFYQWCEDCNASWYKE